MEFVCCICKIGIIAIAVCRVQSNDRGRFICNSCAIAVDTGTSERPIAFDLVLCRFVKANIKLEAISVIMPLSTSSH